MGQLTRQTRTELATWADDPQAGEFGAFLDDVAEGSFKAACEERMLAQGAVLVWLAGSEVRSNAYAAALQVKAEVLMHETLEIADGATVEDVSVAKLRNAAREKVSGHWNERYRPRVNVQHAGEVRIDAGLTVRMGELLDLIGSGVVHESPQALDAADRTLPDAVALPEPAGAVEEFRI